MNHPSPELIHALMADRLAEAERARRGRSADRAAPPRWRRHLPGPRHEQR
ncbi:hypothetical protein [Georgenia satyanarayanai]|nr:hypothetical protein [Georgenia satyanarayanai]